MVGPEDSLTIFRVLVPAKDLAESRQFYEMLLGTPGRAVAEGRVYIDCGPVILGIVDYSGHKETEFPRSLESIYFATRRLEDVHRRARTLGCTSTELLHEDPNSPLGEIVVRPWGERSFYAEDPSGNSLCFVDADTRFTGTLDQIQALQRGHAD
jgi:catechol 2,3-dioxygenase-like lactoylglutathione lyase family enzyme